MFAVIRAGGRQYKVETGDLLKVDKFEASVGDEVTWGEVLLLGDDDKVVVGSPIIKDVKVVGRVEAQGRGRKIIVLKQKRRKGYRRKQGHRQYYTSVRINEIVAGELAREKPAPSEEAGKEQANVT